MANKQINVEADFPSKSSSQIITSVMKFIGAGTAGDGRATAEEIVKAYGLTETEINTLVDQNLEKTYKIPDVDLTATGYTTLAIRTGKTFIANSVVVWHKTITNWTVAPSGTVLIGFAESSDVPGTAADWYDSFSDSIGIATSSHDMRADDTVPKVGGDSTTAYDLLFINVDTARTATNLVADVFISGFEF